MTEFLWIVLALIVGFVAWLLLALIVGGIWKILGAVFSLAIQGIWMLLLILPWILYGLLLLGVGGAVLSALGLGF